MISAEAGLAGTTAESTAEAWLERAEDLLDGRELAGSLAAYGRAEALGAAADRCSAGRWMIAMLGGDFAAAWVESDAIRGRGAEDPHRFWNGEEIDGARMMVRCLHGFGDAVQMLRYAPLLEARAASVVFEVAPRLAPLARYFRGVREVVTWGGDAPRTPVAWDVQVEVMELPYLFRTTVEELPVATGYLELPGGLVRDAGLAMDRARLRVGLVWAGGEWNPGRWAPFGLMRRLLEVEGVAFWNLQGGVAAEDAVGVGMGVCGDGLVALAGAMANLDLVITVDTLAAHMAGALGVPVWVMLQRSADWRWMTGREDSPWYPGMRLFRQEREGDWGGLMEAVREALIAEVSAGCGMRNTEGPATTKAEGQATATARTSNRRSLRDDKGKKTGNGKVRRTGNGSGAGTAAASDQKG